MSRADAIAPMAGTNQLDLNLLRDTSRSFYRTLAFLPRPVRPQIGLAYLLARTSDTIADTELVPADQRRAALRRLSGRIQGTTSDPLEFGELARHQGSAAERRLLDECESALALLRQLPAADQQLIRNVLEVISSGQDLDLVRFSAGSPGDVIALETADELDDYTYRVAGCVGEFWTRMCRAHLFPRAPLNEPWLLEQGVRFGKGLQLVNVLRDLSRDLRQGRCYLPAEQLRSIGLKPADLLDPANERKLRPIYDPWLNRAQAHLAAGWSYTLALPWSCARVRLACAWPILIGVETLKLLGTGNVLDPGQRLKISRKQVKRLMLRSMLLYPFPALWRRLAKPSV